MLKKILILFLGTFVAMSCSESFNSVYEDVEEQDPNVTPPGDVDMTKVNILPTLSDPLYSIAGTRAQSGPGPFESWDEDNGKRWLSTRFQVFGLRTTNAVGGGANYSAASNGNTEYGVLWNQSMRITDQQGSTQFYDENDAERKPIIYSYNADEKLYRYKFFLLGTDGLTDGLPEKDYLQVESNKIHATLQLDGTHDVLHSFAYHSDQQFMEAVSQLPNDETTKVFLDGGENASSNQYMYNRLSGNRGIHPIFNTKHLLSRFDICVKGGNPNIDKNCDFLKMFITNVEIKAVSKVDIVVADDAWEHDSYEDLFKANQLIRQAAPADYYPPLDIVPCEMRNTAFTTANRGDIDFDALAAECKAWNELHGGDPVIPEGSHWVSSTEKEALCKTVLLPPLLPEDGGFVIRLSYRYLYTHLEKKDPGDPNSEEVWRLGLAETPSDKAELYNDELDVLIPITNNPKYEGGHKYSVVITIYGPSVIRVDVGNLDVWTENDGDINVGEDM